MTDRAFDTNVLIIGAGPAGLALAVELARRGIAFRIIDRAEGPAAESRALGTQARTIEHLRMMGIGADRLTPSLIVRGITIHDGERRLATLPTHVSRPDVTYDGLLVMAQADTEQMLLRRLDELGARVERSTTLAALSQDGDGVLATLDGANGAEVVHSRYLVACDGARSTVRHHLRAGFAGATYPQEFLLADGTIDADLPRDLGNGWLHPDGLLFLLPLPEPGLWRVIVNAERPGEDDRTPPSLEDITTIVARRTGGSVQLVNTVWRSRFRINCRMVDHYRYGNVFLAGDAAHVHSPVGGQGLNTGIQDAVNLAWKLSLASRGRAATSLLDTYAEERMPVARGVLNGTDKGTRAIMTANPALRWLRDRAISAVSNIPAVQGALIKRISELGLDYRASSLTSPANRAGFDPGAPRPGDRAPQADLYPLAGDVPATLFDAYGRGGFTLLLFPDPTHLA
ncbi:MAG: FAD-dependent monooxygenase, partial [Thermomicrobiales bacterium]